MGDYVKLHQMVYQSAVCIRVHCVSECSVYQNAVCIRVQCVSECSVYQSAVCIRVQCVSEWLCGVGSCLEQMVCRARG